MRNHPDAEVDRTRREDRHLKFYELRDNLFKGAALVVFDGDRLEAPD